MDEVEQDRRADAQLARQLLRAGVGRRHVRRAVRELGDHREDLLARMLAAGRERVAARCEARQLLGDRATLAAQMIARPELQSRARRFAWLLFGLAPLPMLFVAALLVMFIGAAFLESISFIWSLPSLTGPQVMVIARPLLLWVVPLLVGLLLCGLAVRHWVPAFWPLFAVAIVAWCSGLTFFGEMDDRTIIAFGMLPPFRSPLPEYLRIATLFCGLGAIYLRWRRAQLRSFADA